MHVRNSVGNEGYGSGMDLAIFIVAFLTLAVVVTAELRQRRNAPYASLAMRELGTMNRSDTGELVHHIWTLTNEGTGDAQISMIRPVACEIEFSDEHPPFTVIRAGETKRLHIKPCDLDKAWILVIWAPSHLQDQWEVEGFAVRQELSAQMLLPRVGPILRRLPKWTLTLINPIRRRTLSAEPVGPGGVALTRIRLGSKHWQKDFSIALSIVDPDMERVVEKVMAAYRDQVAKYGGGEA